MSESAIDAVQTNIRWHYAHTSHGGQLTTGLQRLESMDARYDVAQGSLNLPTVSGAFNVFDVPYEHPHYNLGQAGHTSYENCENKGKAIWVMMSEIEAAQPVPLPAGIWLLGSGLIGIRKRLECPVVMICALSPDGRTGKMQPGLTGKTNV